MNRPGDLFTVIYKQVSEKSSFPFTGEARFHFLFPQIVTVWGFSKSLIHEDTNDPLPKGFWLVYLMSRASFRRLPAGPGQVLYLARLQARHRNVTWASRRALCRIPSTDSGADT